MMHWDGENNKDPPTMDDYDRVRRLRGTPSDDKVLDEVNDLSKLVAELNANPSVPSYRISEKTSEEDDEDDVANDEDSVHDGAKQEEDIVPQGPMIQDAPSGKEESTTITTTTESSTMPSKQQASSSRSRKRRGDGSSNGSAKTKKHQPPNKWSDEEKEELRKEVIANGAEKFILKRDSVISRLPTSYRIGDIGVVVKSGGNKKYVVLVCHPYQVPPKPVREDWLKLYFKVTRQFARVAICTTLCCVTIISHSYLFIYLKFGTLTRGNGRLMPLFIGMGKRTKIACMVMYNCLQSSPTPAVKRGSS